MGRFAWGADLRKSPLYQKKVTEELKEEAPEVEIKKRTRKKNASVAVADTM